MKFLQQYGYKQAEGETAMRAVKPAVRDSKLPTHNVLR